MFDLVARCRAQRYPWSLDLEPASFQGGLDTIAPLLAGARLVFCNDRAAAAIGEDVSDRLLGMGVGGVIRTMGARGARLVRRNLDIHSPTPSLAVVDTTGAGDCLAGWLIGELLSGTPEAEALDRAVLAASLSCLGLGAQHSYPYPDDLEAWRRKNRQGQSVLSSEAP